MTRSDFGAAIRAYLADHGPATMREVSAAVGCSRQRAYAWADEHAAELVQDGAGAYGAARYRLVDTAARTGHTVVGIGTVLEVRSLRLEDGHAVLIVAGEDGVSLELEVRRQWAGDGARGADGARDGARGADGARGENRDEVPAG